MRGSHEVAIAEELVAPREHFPLPRHSCVRGHFQAAADPIHLVAPVQSLYRERTNSCPVTRAVAEEKTGPALLSWIVLGPGWIEFELDDSFLINNKAIYLLLLRAHCCVSGAIVVPCHYAAERRFAWWLCGRWADVHSIHLEGDMFIITQSAAQSVVSTVSHSVITSRASAPQQYKTISTVCILFHCTDYASVDYVDDGDVFD